MSLHRWCFIRPLWLQFSIVVKFPDSNRVKVYVRVRPFTKDEKNKKVDKLPFQIGNENTQVSFFSISNYLVNTFPVTQSQLYLLLCLISILDSPALCCGGNDNIIVLKVINIFLSKNVFRCVYLAKKRELTKRITYSITCLQWTKQTKRWANHTQIYSDVTDAPKIFIELCKGTQLLIKTS